MSEKITSQMIRDALTGKYQPPEWYLGFEVGNSTGLNCNRHADAVAINAYPSKGYETRGFEIKVSRADLAKELETGIKSEEIATYCDYWFLVVPSGLTKGFTLPPAWGVLEYRDGKLVQTKSAEKTEKSDPSKGFLCAMLRGRERAVREAGREEAAKKEAEIEHRFRYLAGDASKELEALKRSLETIREKTGISLNRWSPTDEIIKKLNAVAQLNIISRNIPTITWEAKSMLETAEKIKKAVSEMNLDETHIS